jgi:hypothetical protein
MQSGIEDVENYYIRFELSPEIASLEEISWNKYIQFIWFDMKLARNRGIRTKQVCIFKELRSKIKYRLERYVARKITFEQFKEELIKQRQKIMEKYPEHFYETGWYDKMHIHVQQDISETSEAN